MRTIRILAAAAATLTLTHTAHAQIPYTWLQADYQNISIDTPVEVDAEGYGLEGSLQLGPNVYLLGRYRNFDTDVFEVIQDELFGEQLVDVDGRLALETYSAGLGLVLPVSEQLNVFGELAYERVRARARHDLAFLGSESEDGYSATGGVRFLVGPQVELRGSVTHIDLDGSDTLLNAEAVVYLLPILSLVGGYTRGSDIDGYNIGVRINLF